MYSFFYFHSNIPVSFGLQDPFPVELANNKGSGSTENMVWIDGGTFDMGGDNDQASADEFPKHKVSVDGFWMDVTEVTNAQFAAFVEATAYVTTAEMKPDWEELDRKRVV